MTTGGEMSPRTLVALRAAAADPVVVQRYWSHVRKPAVTGECWLWTGAISGKGHGRFSIGDHYSTTTTGQRRRTTIVVIAHRFGYAIRYGVDALLGVPILGHSCDNPLCQNPAHWRESNARLNGIEYSRRRSGIRSPLADLRGARGRSREIRDAARDGADVAAAVVAGVRPVHRDQTALFD